jgi:PPP family 3-phenylpropionic acid transporter
VLAQSLRIREAPRVDGAHAPPLLAVLRQPAVIAFFAQAALMVGAHTSLYAFYSLYLERAGYGKTLLGAMWSLGVLAEVMFFYFQAGALRRIGVRAVMMASFAVAVLRFGAIGLGAGWLAVLVLAQLLHAFTFAAHHCASITAMQRWFGGPLQARGQALFMSIAHGIGGTFGGLFMSWCWESFGPGSVYGAAIGLTVLAAAAAALFWKWESSSVIPAFAGTTVLALIRASPPPPAAACAPPLSPPAPASRSTAKTRSGSGAPTGSGRPSRRR